MTTRTRRGGTPSCGQQGWLLPRILRRPPLVRLRRLLALLLPPARGQRPGRCRRHHQRHPGTSGQPGHHPGGPGHPGQPGRPRYPGRHRTTGRPHRWSGGAGRPRHDPRGTRTGGTRTGGTRTGGTRTGGTPAGRTRSPKLPPAHPPAAGQLTAYRRPGASPVFL